MFQSQNNLRRFLPGASRIRHPLYNYVSQRFYANFARKENINLINVQSHSVTKGKYHWMNYASSNFYSVIDMNVLEKELKLFFNFYKANYPNHEFFAIVFKLQLPNDDIRTCQSLQISSTIDEKFHFNQLLTAFSHIFLVANFLESVSEKEEDNLWFDKETGYPAGTFIFAFKALKTIKGTKYENMYKSTENMKRKMLEGKDFIKDFDYKGYKIPSSMDIVDWPNIIFTEDFKHAHTHFIFSKNIQKNEKLRLDFDFIINDDNYSATVTNRDTDTTLFTFTDTLNNPYDLTDFKRVIIDKNIKKTYNLFDGEVLLYSKDIHVDYIKPITEQQYFKPKIMTLDFETRDIKTVDPDTGRDIIIKVPICMCIYDGENSFYFLFKDHNNWINDLMKALRNTIMKRKYNGYKIYIHNFSHFDSVFMIDVLSRLGDVKKPLFRDNAILKLPFEFRTNNKNKEKYAVTFYDSMLILPAPLRDLSKSFGVENKKDFFPYGLLNDENMFSFDYKGPVPEYKYFLNSLTKKEYNEYCERYKGKIWNLRRELYLYCEIDCIALHQIILKFHKQIHDLLKIDITRYPTLSSIAFSGYRTNFMKKDQIPKILSRLHYTIKESYYGGITEVYKGKGFNINSYDINSLYPSAMLNNPMPVGFPKYFSGNILLSDPNAFGFFKVKVSTPLDLNKPTLPMRLKTEDGVRTVFPTGTWTSWYFSEEIKDKWQDGYSFEVLEGYCFEKDYIFTEYINLLYEIKCNTDSSDSLYYIAKLLMNALYGRFGLNPEAREVVIVTHEESEKIIAERKNVLIIPLLGGKVMVSYDLHSEEEINITDISVSVSSAIAAYSRIEMSKYIRKYDKNLLYIDTDGIKVDTELDASEIDNKKLGKMKYEFSFKEAVFPGLKVYGGLLSEPYKKFKDWIVKVKGLKVDISYYHLNSMNNKYNPSIIEQEKWKRYLHKSVILVKKENYTLGLNENKREMIFNSWGDFVDTIPLYLKDGVLEKRNPPALHYLPAPSPINKICASRVDDYKKDVINPEYERVSSQQESRSNELVNSTKQSFIESEKLHDLEKLVSNSIHESMMLAGNEAEMLIFKITGIMYSSDGDMYYYEGEGHNSRRVYIKANGVWLNENLILKSGRLRFKDDWAPSCNLDGENPSCYIDKPPDKEINTCSISNSLTIFVLSFMILYFFFLCLKICIIWLLPLIFPDIINVNVPVSVAQSVNVPDNLPVNLPVSINLIDQGLVKLPNKIFIIYPCENFNELINSIDLNTLKWYSITVDKTQTWMFWYYYGKVLNGITITGEFTIWWVLFL